MFDQPDAEGKSGGGDDRSSGDVAGRGDYGEEDEQCREERKRRQIEKGSDEAGDGFSAAELQKHGIGMAGHDGERGEGGQERIVVAEFGREPDGEESLGDIEQKSGHGDAASGGAQDVGGADVAAAFGAHVLSGGEFYQQEAERDSADQVGNRDNANSGSKSVHVRVKSASLVYFPPRER